MFSTTLSREYALAAVSLGLDDDDLRRLAVEAMDFAFLSAAAFDQRATEATPPATTATTTTATATTATAKVNVAAEAEAAAIVDATNRALAAAIRRRLETGAAAWEGLPSTALERIQISLRHQLRARKNRWRAGSTSLHSFVSARVIRWRAACKSAVDDAVLVAWTGGGDRRAQMASWSCAVVGGVAVTAAAAATVTLSREALTRGGAGGGSIGGGGGGGGGGRGGVLSLSSWSWVGAALRRVPLWVIGKGSGGGGADAPWFFNGGGLFTRSGGI